MLTKIKHTQTQTEHPNKSFVFFYSKESKIFVTENSNEKIVEGLFFT